MNPELKLHEEKMTKTISVLREELAAIRAGRANPAVLDKLEVDYYGVPTPIQQVASISVPDPRSLMIQPWDASSHTISLPLNPSRRPFRLLILVSIPITMVLSCAFCSHLSPKSAEKI